MKYLRSPGYLLGYLVELLLRCFGSEFAEGGVIKVGRGSRQLIVAVSSNDDGFDGARSVEELLRQQMAQYQVEEDRRFFEG